MTNTTVNAVVGLLQSYKTRLEEVVKSGHITKGNCYEYVEGIYQLSSQPYIRGLVQPEYYIPTEVLVKMPKWNI